MCERPGDVVETAEHYDGFDPAMTRSLWWTYVAVTAGDGLRRQPMSYEVLRAVFRNDSLSLKDVQTILGMRTCPPRPSVSQPRSAPPADGSKRGAIACSDGDPRRAGRTVAYGNPLGLAFATYADSELQVDRKEERE
jgi:hypothetical protein